MINKERLEKANSLLQIMSDYPRATKELKFSTKGGRLYLSDARHTQQVVLNSTRDWLYRRSRLSIGGTEEQTLVQIALWVKELPCLPAKNLSGYYSKQMWGDGLESDQPFKDKLKEIGYDCNCIICSKPTVGLMWVAIGKKIGPSCKECGRETYRKYSEK